MPFIDANGLKLHYELRGDGPPLCLIIGYRLHGGAWPAAFLDRLAKRFKVLTFDNRGTGLSDKPQTGYAIDRMADDAAALLAALSIEKSHVLGFSMGGAVAQELALRHAGCVDRLVLFATFAGAPFAIPASWSVMRHLFGIENMAPEDAARQMWPVTYSARHLAECPAEVKAQMKRETARPTPPFAASGQASAIRFFSSGLRLPLIQAPTLVATGEEDALVPPGNSRILATAIPRARLVTVPSLAHRAIWEAPNDMADLVTSFLTEGEELAPAA